MSITKKLSFNFLDAVDRADLYAEAAESAAPVVDKVLGAISDDSVFRTDEMAAVAGNTD
jgi:hypothetical protein